MTRPETPADGSRPAGKPVGPKRRGRLVLKPSDVDEHALEAVRRELAELRAAHNDLVWQINRQSRWLASFAEMWDKLVKHAPWRFCAWVLPIPVRPYETHEELSYLQLRDARPDYGTNDET